MTRFLWTLIAILIWELISLYAADALAQEHLVTLRGTLFAAETECHFFLDPEGDSESVGLDASSGSYLCDWLKGGNARAFTITLRPGK